MAAVDEGNVDGNVKLMEIIAKGSVIQKTGIKKLRRRNETVGKNIRTIKVL